MSLIDIELDIGNWSLENEVFSPPRQVEVRVCQLRGCKLEAFVVTSVLT